MFVVLYHISLLMIYLLLAITQDRDENLPLSMKEEGNTKKPKKIPEKKSKNWCLLSQDA